MTTPERAPGPASADPQRPDSPSAPAAPDEQPSPAGRQFPCKQCGATLVYDPDAGAPACPYCGYVEKIGPKSSPIEEHDLFEYLKRQTQPIESLAGHSSQVTCESCKAVVLVEDHVVMDRCPYCGSVIRNAPVATTEMIEPESLLPFAISKAKAVGAFAAWVASRWFAPSALTKLANLGELSGVYMPYWTYDAMTNSHYKGSRGDDYTVMEQFTTTNAQGQTIVESRPVTHTSWTRVSGEVEHFFNDILVYASTSLPEKSIAALEPWELPELQPFDPAFLAGFKTERYTIPVEAGFQIASTRMDAMIRQLCCRDIGGDHQQIDSIQTERSAVTFKHLLLPLWLAAYKYEGRAYQVLINARSGEVSGTRPYSVAKIAALVTCVAAAVATVAYAIWLNQ